MPATVFLEVASAALAAATGRRAARVEHVELLGALALRGTGEPTTVQVHILGDADRATFSISSLRGDDEWFVHATGLVSADALEDQAGPADLESIRGRCADPTAYDRFYDDLAGRGVHFGDSFRGLSEIRRGASEALGLVVAPPAPWADTARYAFHPALLDAAMQPINALLPDGTATFLPVAIDELRLHRRADEPDVVARATARGRRGRRRDRHRRRGDLRRR